MSRSLEPDELDRQLTTMLRERAGGMSERVPVDRTVVTRARRRRSVKKASLGSAIGLSFGVVVAAALAFSGSPTSSRKNQPVSPGPSLQLTTPHGSQTPPIGPSAPTPWAKLPPAPISARSASATEVIDDTFVVWGGEGQRGERLMDGAWYDIGTRKWHRMSASPLSTPSYPAGQHFVIAQAVGNSVVIVSDGAAAAYTPRTDRWRRLPDVPLAGLDNLALNDSSSPDAVVLTGVDGNGRPAFAALAYNPNGPVPAGWGTGTLTGRSVGRPALTGNGLIVLVREDGALRVDRAEFSGAAVASPAATLPNDFIPTIWTGKQFIGGERTTGPHHSTFVEFDPRTAVVTTYEDAYEACAGLHVWTGRSAVSWGIVNRNCYSPPHDVAYDTTTGAIVRGLLRAPIAERRFADFAVAPSGAVFVWGGQDANGVKLADGAVLELP